MPYAKIYHLSILVHICIAHYVELEQLMVVGFRSRWLETFL